MHQPGYSSWVIGEGTSASYTESEVNFTVVSDGFTSSWYKAGVQNPYYARLANDGLVSPDVTITISGLPAGEHSFLTFHNSFNNPETNTFSPIDIYVNGELKIDNLEQTNRVLKDTDAATAFVTFDVDESGIAEIRYRYDPASTASDKAVYLNGFELNTADAARQPTSPYPADQDEHASADNGAIDLRWKSAEGALSHNIYFSENEAQVVDGSAFLGNQQDTVYSVTLSGLKKYYWRVDEIYSQDTVKGDIWYFQPRRVAFEGAEGYGRYAIGGRGGKVVAVTNLNDSGPGSLREAVENDIGPRTIVFQVSGIIELEERLSLKDDYVTVAGQTAPGKGICIKGAPFGMSGANDCIIQNVRVRLGSGRTFDGMGMSGSDHCIIDHCSISWTIDESFSSRNAKNITLQRTLISEPLNIADHKNYPDGSKHGYAASISGDKGSFHHNLLAHSYGRNWSLAGGLDGNGFYAGRLDISNNVVYNFGSRTTDGGAHEVNFVNNYYKPGPGHQGNNYALNAQYDNFPGTQRYYFAGNIMEGVFDESNQENGRRYSGTPQGYSPWVKEPFFDHQINLQPAEDAYKDVLSDVGCRYPLLDEHDQRIIEETLTGTYTYTGSRSRIPGMPDSHEDVGGWEEYPEETRDENWDSDLDGLPNWWEELHGLDIKSGEGDFSDPNGDIDGDTFTNLEEYVQWIGSPHIIASVDSVVVIDLSAFAQGYSHEPVFEIMEVTNGTVELLETKGEAQFMSKSKGLSDFTFKVTDADGSSKIITVGVAVGMYSETAVEPEGETLGIRRVNGLKAYPNPSLDRTHLTCQDEIRAFAVYSLTGQRMTMAENLTGTTHSIDVSGLPRGVYLIKAESSSGTYEIKFIK